MHSPVKFLIPFLFFFCLNQNKTGLQMDSKEKIILGYQKAF